MVDGISEQVQQGIAQFLNGPFVDSCFFSFNNQVNRLVSFTGQISNGSGKGIKKQGNGKHANVHNQLLGLIHKSAEDVNGFLEALGKLFHELLPLLILKVQLFHGQCRKRKIGGMVFEMPCQQGQL